MAHSCPECYCQCYCGGDIDDCCLDGGEDQMNCIHCLNAEDEIDEDDYTDDDVLITGKK